MPSSKQSFLLPKLKYKFKTPLEADRFIFYDVKFCPYLGAPHNEPVFAIVGQKRVLIGRLSTESNVLVTMLHELEDEQEVADPSSPGLNSCSWCYIDAQRPLVAVAGGSGQLKVIDALTGEIFATLTGHGHGTINDIATHPLYPWIVVTASMDKSLRIWDLRRHAHRHESPTIIVCGQATGHSEGVLTVSWHLSGRYLVTGGHDQRICVWTIPDLDDESSFWTDLSPPNRERSSDEVQTIYFPHFTSSAVHSDFVDCARFYGDLILSKAANENRIVLWKITGFDSGLPPPDSLTAPKIEGYLDTRNGFVRTVTSLGNGVVNVDVAEEFVDQPPYERLLEFETYHIAQFYLRFSVLMPSPDYPALHPILAFANARSELRFWDLERLALGHAGDIDGAKGATAKKKRKGIAVRVKPSERRSYISNGSQSLGDRESPFSTVSNISSGPWPTRHTSTGATSEVSVEVVQASAFPPRDRERYPLHESHEPLKPHAKVSLIELQHKNRAFNARAADWSPCGRWCIVVGESSLSADGGIGGFAVLQR